MNTGLICSCTLAFKPFFRYLASKSFSKNTYPDVASHPLTNVAFPGRSDSGALVRQDTGGRGFVVLGDNETEMHVSHVGSV